MYLSRLILNTRNYAVRRDLADCQQLHRTILSAFPQCEMHEAGARAQFGMLFRVDTDRANGNLRLLIQSDIIPDWSKLPDGYLAISIEQQEDNPRCKPIHEIYHSLQPGMRLMFRLRANPTRKIDTKSGPNGEKRNGKRVEVRGEEKQIEWLERKAGECGFQLLSVNLYPEVPSLQISPESKMSGYRERKEGGAARLTFNSVLFDGELTITDPQQFLQALKCGIGSGKAYGFGLLSIAPAREVII
jgi:CRISPR system Cascade subunit CasE